MIFRKIVLRMCMMTGYDGCLLILIARLTDDYTESGLSFYTETESCSPTSV